MEKDGVPLQDDSDEETSPNTYECVDCGHQTEAMAQPGQCPECDGQMVDVGEPSDS